jgi:hypothetical protein
MSIKKEINSTFQLKDISFLQVKKARSRKKGLTNMGLIL